jgi:hypothetical protein
MEQPKIIKQICEKHGEQDFVLGRNGNYRCKQCRAEKAIQRRQKNSLDSFSPEVINEIIKLGKAIQRNKRNSNNPEIL